MKKKYITPKAEIVRVEAEPVLAASPGEEWNPGGGSGNIPVIPGNPPEDDQE